MTKLTKWLRPAKTQISLGFRPVWSESPLSAWRKLGSLATHWAHSEDSDQTGRMPRLIWVSLGAHSVCWFCHVVAFFWWVCFIIWLTTWLCLCTIVPLSFNVLQTALCTSTTSCHEGEKVSTRKSQVHHYIFVLFLLVDIIIRNLFMKI